MSPGAGELQLDPAAAPPPDRDAEPAGFVVVVEPNDRIHFLDWGGPAERHGEHNGAGVLMVHGLSATAWIWAPVARRLRTVVRTVAMDLRGHGLSDAPTAGYDCSTLAGDVVAVAEGSGVLDGTGRVVLAGLGFGAVVAAWAAVALADRCAGLLLTDGGWEDLRASTGVEPAEFVRALDEPPEVFRSMTAYLADRESFHPGTWDADQVRAARAAVVELPAGRVVPSSRPHAVAGSVEAMFDYRPVEVLATVGAPIVALGAAEDEAGGRGHALDEVVRAVAARGGPRIDVARFPHDGHNLPRYRPAEVTVAVLRLATATQAPGGRR